MKLSIAIPLFNESYTVPELYKRIRAALKRDFKKWNYEIIFVDDGSTDKTFHQLVKLRRKDKRIKVIQFSRNFGHHIALTAALNSAKGDYIVMMDGDLQDQPEEIIKLYKKLREGYDVVYAKRENKHHSLLKKIFSNIFNILMKNLIREKIIINSTIFRIMTRQVNEQIQELTEQNRYLIGIIGWVGFKHGEQQVEHGVRFGGKTKYTFSQQYTLALNALLAFSDYPLKMIVKIGFFFVFLSFLMIIYILIKKLIYNTPVIGWSSLITSIFAVGGIQIIILGIIGEYVGRNYMESKNRPLYIVKKILR